jgi:hypothetical protein
MQEEQFREYLRQRQVEEPKIEEAVQAIQEYENYLSRQGKAFDSSTVDDVKEYVWHLMAVDRNTMDRLQALARYSYLVKKNDVYVYFTQIISGRTVLPTISERLTGYTSKEVSDSVFENLDYPPLGSGQDAYPPVTKLLMKRLESELSPEIFRKVLAGNNHRVPVEAFTKHKEWLKEAGSIDRFLEKVHEEAVGELESYLAEGKIWYEQEITPETVEYVRGNQEVLSGVRKGNRIYITKFPYAPQKWLDETDPRMKRYYMCHCPLARAAILTEDDVPMDWCYCSGGFEKLMFDVVFEEDTEVEVLESALGGSTRCRFAVRIPEGYAD